MSESKIIIGISQGDINGIGPEVILKTLIEPGINDICTPVLFSSQKTISYYRKVLGLEEFNFHPLRDFSQINNKKVNVMICYEEEVNIEMGKLSETGGKYARISLDHAAKALQENQIHALVTAPINKSNIQGDGFHFPGHTEYLAHKLGGDPLMILCSENGLRVALATGHIPLNEVASRITTEVVTKKITLFYESLVKDFAIRKPKIAVLGLNPHAGDNGTIGAEEQNIIRPAIEQLKLDALIYGPYSADGFFGTNAYKKFDGILAMYHDQGLIPFKTMAFNDGVNFTAGLNKIRTSPDHGTAFEIAGKNEASELSFRNALYMAIDLYRNRKLHAEITANPLAHGNLRKER
ncbi:MAG: 4-hydroxythreonine-4-phosphate dehydrogenase PdxA [Bacteroidia bacterium]|jgi:4-hydroxythreonine-4-phosphate dehydrogenase|nr:4-hydroxythreonine-4-phosphate dehydrogenase PdxA [Bacteroidia bacterium]